MLWVKQLNPCVSLLFVLVVSKRPNEKSSACGTRYCISTEKRPRVCICSFLSVYLCLILTYVYKCEGK